MSRPRIAQIGARRVRQGLGPFVARFLHEGGADVAAFLGTSAGSVQAAAEDLERLAGLRPRGYTDLDDLLEREGIDALAILSPAETHERYLDVALRRRLHVLCEKPLVWGADDACARGRAVAEAFAASGLQLTENCQWPQVLAAFEDLHGPVGALRSFAMRLTPASRGAQMLGDALPHPLSLLQALEPDEEATLEEVTLSTHAPDAEELVLEGTHVTPRARVPVRVELIRGETLPREASLTINGLVARRRVRMDDYALFLGDGTREVPLADPLRAHLQRFLLDLRATLNGAPPPPTTPIVRRAAMLDVALRAFLAPPAP